MPLLSDFLKMHSGLSAVLECEEKFLDLVKNSIDVTLRIGDTPADLARHDCMIRTNGAHPTLKRLFA